MIILAHRCTQEYHITCMFGSLCEIENWVPAYQTCYCLLCAMWHPWLQ